jgi:diacylglycerol kinase family enzyme
MLVIINPFATTVSERLRNIVVHALQARYEVDAVDTESPGHATSLCREAARAGYDVVVAFGGDGTVNEAANGLAGSSTALTCLPGGSANVFAKILGIPSEIVDATEHLLGMADDWHPRRVDLGRVDERRFTFAAGVGIDASVVERVDANPRLKARYGAWYFTWAALSSFARRYLIHPPRLIVSVDGRELAGVTALVQNASPFTYFNDRPIAIAEGVTLDSGNLAGIVLERATLLELPTIAWRATSPRARVVRHRRVTGFQGVQELVVRSADQRRLPLQADGDFLGEVSEARFAVEPQALTVVS